MKRARPTWRKRDDQVSPVGVPYSDVARENICLEAGCPLDEAAATCSVSSSTVARVWKRQRETGSPDALPHSGGSNPTLNLDDKSALYMHAQLFPVATLRERQLFMCGLRGKLASVSALCKVLKLLGFSRKIAQYYSRNRDQLSRARWFSRGPAIAQGRHAYGVHGVPTDVLVDIDEAICYFNRATRKWGIAPRGAPARLAGTCRHEGPTFNILLAVDTRVGVIASLVFQGAVTAAVFATFVLTLVLPRLTGTGRRMTMCDNAKWHNERALNELTAHFGHIHRFRPIHRQETSLCLQPPACSHAL